jgi:hypothetical protein
LKDAIFSGKIMQTEYLRKAENVSNSVKAIQSFQAQIRQKERDIETYEASIVSSQERVRSLLVQSVSSWDKNMEGKIFAEEAVIRGSNVAILTCEDGIRLLREESANAELQLIVQKQEASVSIHSHAHTHIWKLA